MKPYTVYIRFGDKKLKTTVLAKDPLDAEEIVRNKVQVLQVKAVPLDEAAPTEPTFDSAMDMLDQVMDALGGARHERPRRQTWRERLEAAKVKREQADRDADAAKHAPRKTDTL